MASMSSRLSSPQYLSNPTGLAIFVCGEASSVRVCLCGLHLSIGIGEDAACFLEVLLACNISRWLMQVGTVHTALRYHANYVLHPH